MQIKLFKTHISLDIYVVDTNLIERLGKKFANKTKIMTIKSTFHQRCRDILTEYIYILYGLFF